MPHSHMEAGGGIVGIEVAFAAFQGKIQSRNWNQVIAIHVPSELPQPEPE